MGNQKESLLQFRCIGVDSTQICPAEKFNNSSWDFINSIGQEDTSRFVH